VTVVRLANRKIEQVATEVATAMAVTLMAMTPMMIAMAVTQTMILNLHHLRKEGKSEKEKRENRKWGMKKW
jgi:predicted cobalt transporter CbtA